MDTEWFKARKKELKLTDAKLGEALGVERSVANRVVNGDVEFNAKRADAVAKLFQVSRDEILFRAGISDHKPIPAPARQQPDRLPTATADRGESVEILALDISVAMGSGTIIDDFVESEPVVFDMAMLRRLTRTPFDRLRLITGVGNSHEPRFHHNDQFLIDINDRQLSRLDGYYWITLFGAHALKRLRPIGRGKIEIISENPDFAPQEVDAEDVRIEGRAIWVARGL